MAPTFCKCTCFKNSTIIRLGPQDSASGPSAFHSQPEAEHPSPRSPLDPLANDPPPPTGLSRRAASASCAQCNRAFCLHNNLPICKGAEEKDVVSMCFQRDSRKDQIIVWGFILGTTGLLGWAAAKRLLELREGKESAARPEMPQNSARGEYMPVGG